MTAPPSPLLSPEDAAEYLHTTRRRVLDLARAGHIARVQDGRAVSFTVEALDAYIRRVTVAAQKPFQTTR